MVELSMNSVPGRAEAIRPAGPRNTSRTCWPLGSMVMTASAPSVTATVEDLHVIPALPAASIAEALTSKPRTSWPAFARLAAIGPPMLPSPINPTTLMIVSSFAFLCWSEAQFLGAERGEVGGDGGFRYFGKSGRLPAG